MAMSFSECRAIHDNPETLMARIGQITRIEFPCYPLNALREITATRPALMVTLCAIPPRGK
jgi:hypothetical protein